MHAERPQPRTIVVSFAMTAILACVLLATPRQSGRVGHEAACTGALRPPVATRVVAPCTYEPDVIALLERIAAVEIALDAAMQRPAGLERLHAEAAQLRAELGHRRARCGQEP
jgi:hypothetical protein